MYKVLVQMSKSESGQNTIVFKTHQLFISLPSNQILVDPLRLQYLQLDYRGYTQLIYVIHLVLVDCSAYDRMEKRLYLVEHRARCRRR